MKVFVVSSGECHMGGSARSVHATAEGARSHALKLVADGIEKNKASEAHFREEGMDMELFSSMEWRESSPDFWSDGLDWVSVREFEVQP
jgi:hypothetical protein